MARPTFKIEPARLRALREERGLTQEALANKLGQHLGKPDSQDLVRHYQRIEREGQTSRDYAQALAAILEVDLRLLQGIDSPDALEYRRTVRRLLEQRLAQDAATPLHAMLARHAEPDPDDALEYLAEDIAERIERAQLVRNPSRVAELVAMTGLAEADILAPANVRGYWLLAVDSSVRRASKVVNDASEVGFQVGEILRDYLASRAGDSTLRMWRDKNWIRLEIVRPSIRDRMRIDLTRVQPDANGLRWIEPNWRDEFFLFPALASHAWQWADSVTDFDGKTLPGDVGRLRLRVTEHDPADGSPRRQMIVHGDLDDMPASVRDNFASDHALRQICMGWLESGLRDALPLLLAAQPASGWHVSTNGGNVVDIKADAPRYEGPIFARLRYRIDLVEQTGPRSFERVPVRAQALDKLRDAIAAWLEQGCPPAAAGSVVPAFEPI